MTVSEALRRQGAFVQSATTAWRTIQMKALAWILVLGFLQTEKTPESTEKLGIGSAAPPLSVTQWVKGGPVDPAAKGGGITVVEFWATWCGPCVASIPHLTELQHDLAGKGVRVVGVTAHDDGNTLEKVEQFVTKWGDKLGYTIAYDRERKVYASYMDAAERNGIPTAFVVDKSGTIVWIGHPMDGLDDVLAELVSGTFDLALAKKIAAIEERIEDAEIIGEWSTVLARLDEIVAARPGSVGPLTRKFFVNAHHLEDRVAAEKCMRQALKLVKNDPDKLAEIVPAFIHNDFLAAPLEALRHARKIAPKNADVRMAFFSALSAAGKEKEALLLAAETVAMLKGDATRLSRFARTLSSPDRADICGDLALKAVELAIEAEPEEPRHFLTKFSILNECKNDVARASITGQYLIQKAVGDADFLNGFAWNLLTEDATKGKFNELALAAAEEMYKSSGGDRWTHIDTLALAKFENGATAEAIALEKKAIEKCDSEYAVASLKEALERFEKAAK